MDSGPDNVTSSQVSEPWAEQKPFLLSGFNQAQNLFNSPGPSYYPGQTVAGFAPEQTQAQQLGSARALNGSPLNAAAGGYLQDVMGGKYLGENPYTDAVYQGIQSRVLPSVNSNFLSSGRYGSGLHTDMATRALTESLAPYQYGTYSQERGLQQQAAGMAPQIAAEDYRDLGALSAIGAEKQGLAQQQISAEMARHAYNQDLPYNKLAQYMGTIGGNYGQTSTSTQPYYQPSAFSQILGGGLAGIGTLGSLGAFGSGGWF